MAPTTQKAIVVKEKGQIHIVNDKPYPKVAANEIIVNVKAVTLNPTDWKSVDNLLKPGQSTGCDFAGHVVEIGADVHAKSFQVGDVVAGFIRGGVNDADNGTFQEYLKILPELVWKKPESLSYPAASAMGGVGLSTAVQAIYYRLDVPKLWDFQPTDNKSPILVWAGSTSVGLYAVHLAAASGIPVVTTASPHNHDLLRSIGASEVFDYKDPDVADKIKAWGEHYGGISRAFDTISEHGSTEIVAESLSPNGKIVIVLNVAAPQGGWPSNADVSLVRVYTALEPSNKQDFTDMSEWYQQLPGLIESGKIRNVNPLRVDEPAKGWEGIPQGLNDLRAGKASAKKFAYTF